MTSVDSTTGADSTAGATSTASLTALADSSFTTILSLQHPSGAYPASPTFSAYRGYSWFRDGAFIADGVSAWGGKDSASRFFDWCASVLTDRAGEIRRIVAAARAGNPVADDAMLPTRFTFDGEVGSDEWWDFQLDGYGTWLWAVVGHSGRHGVSLDRWQEAIALTVDYLVVSWERPCFDWWEEHAEHVHVSTLGCIAAGLAAIAETGSLDDDRQLAAEEAVDRILALLHDRGVVGDHLAKWLGSGDVDASVLAVVAPMNLFSATDPIAIATVAAVDRQLNVGGGVHRYLGDTFYGGGQWPLLSCFLGLAFAAAGDRERAMTQLEWAASTADGGELPEQVGEHLLDPAREQEWIDRWGTVARPLLWSHAMYLRLAAELGLGGGERA